MSRTWVILAVIVAAGLGLRLSYLASDPHDPRLETLDGELARNLVAGRGFVVNELAIDYTGRLRGREHRVFDPATIDYTSLDRHGDWQPEVFQPVAGGVLLAGVWEISGSEYYLPMQILQAIVDALCALLVFWISWRLFQRRNAALAAAALYALYFPIAWQTTVMYVDIWAVDFTIAIVAVYLRAIGSAHQWRWLAACGLLTGIGVYFRPSLLLLAPVLALASISAVGWRRTLGRALVPVAIALVLVTPWTIRNYHDFHTFTFIRTALGDTMWSGLGEVHNSYGANLNDAVTDMEVHRLRPDLRPQSPKWDNFILQHFVIPTIKSHPLFYAEVVGRRIVRSTLLDYEGPWMHRGVTLPHGRSVQTLVSFGASHPLALLEDSFEPLVFLSAMLTMGLTWRRWRRQHILLIAVLLSALVPYIVIHFEPRYVLPAACVYVVWIGLGIDLLCERAGSLLRVRRARLLLDNTA